MDKKKSIAAGVVSLTLLALGAYNIAANDNNETKDEEVYTKTNAPSEESSSTKKDDKVSVKETSSKQEDKDQSKVVAGKAKVSKDEVLDQLYTTKDGDTIGAIAKENGVSEDIILDVNGIENGNYVQAGWKIAVNADQMKTLADEGSYPNLAKQDGEGKTGRYTYTKPTKPASTPVSVVTENTSKQAENKPEPAKPQVEKNKDVNTNKGTSSKETDKKTDKPVEPPVAARPEKPDYGAIGVPNDWSAPVTEFEPEEPTKPQEEIPNKETDNDKETPVEEENEKPTETEDEATDVETPSDEEEEIVEEQPAEETPIEEVTPEEDIDEDVEVPEAEKPTLPPTEVVDSETEETTEPEEETTEEVVEEVPATDGETSENSEIIDEDIIEEPVTELPAEGETTPETEGGTSEDVVGEETVETPTTPPVTETPSTEVPEGEEETEQPAEEEPVKDIVTTRTYNITTTLNPASEVRYDPTLPVGQSYVVEGTAGSRVETYKEVTVNGVIASTDLIDTQVTASTPTITYYGSKPEAVKVTTKQRTVTTTINFGTTTKQTNDLYEGETRVVTEGINGSRTETYKQTFHNDEFVDEVLIDTQVKDPVNKVIEVGTKKREEVKPKVRIDTVQESSYIKAPTDAIIEYDNTLAKGERKVKRNAKDGVKITTIKVTYENNIEVNREVVNETVQTAPVQAIIVVGTKEAPKTTEHMVTESVTIPVPDAIIKYDNTLEVGKTVTEREGQTGTKQIIYNITKDANGNEIKREYISENVVKEAVAPVIVKGSKQAPKAETKTVTEKETIALDPTVIYNPYFNKNQEFTVVEGQDKIVENQYKITYVDGKQVSKELVGTKVIQEGYAAKVEKGTQDVITIEGVSKQNLSDAEITERANDDSYRVFVTTPTYQNGRIVSYQQNHSTLTEVEREAFNNFETINELKFNQEFAKAVNDERAKFGLSPLAVDTELAKGVLVRAEEVANEAKLDHTRPANEKGERELFVTAFDYLTRNYTSGENIAATFYNGNPYTLYSEEYLATKLFNNWKNSPGHYENMMTNYTDMWVSIQIGDTPEGTDGKGVQDYVYGVNVFGYQD